MRGVNLDSRAKCRCSVSSKTQLVKKGLQFDRVVLLGRTFEEYVRYFALAPDEFRGRRLLDVAAGVSSFCSEANAQGWQVIGFDPIYELAPEHIAARCQVDLELVLSKIHNLSVYRWNFYKDTERLRRFRERSWRTFLSDYQRHRDERYQAGSLPKTPFADRHFDASLVSYFLFVYQDQLSYEFHRDSIVELMRVTSDELRIYPTVTFEGERSIYLNRLFKDPALGHLRFEEIATDFEFLVNSNSFLRVSHR
jgi:hypothetical protein